MKRYTVFWVNENTKEKTQHGTFNIYKDAFQSIVDWWNKNQYKPYYVRIYSCSENQNTTIIDYGLHHCFYHIVEEENNSTNVENE